MIDFKDWIINNYNSNKLSFNSCLFITGYSGTGKTSFINNLITELKLFKYNIDSFNCSTSLQLIDLLTKAFVSSLIQTLTNNNYKKIIVIDDFDILLSFDNTINLALYNFILNNEGKLRNIPIIILMSHNELIKKLGDIKKKCLFIEMPKFDDIYIYNILKNYKNNLELNDVIQINKKTNYNLNQAIKIINNNYFNDNDEIIKINDLYSNDFNRNRLYKIINKEQWIITLNIHENMINELMIYRKGRKKDKENYYKKFILNFCYFDIFMTKDTNIGINFFISTIFNLFNFTLIKNNTNNTGNFTKMLSYLSLQKKNNKNNYYNKGGLPLNEIGNYHLNLINRKFIY